MTIRAKRIERIYDGYEDLEDRDLTQGRVHQFVEAHTREVLRWRLAGQGVGIPHDINFYLTPDPHEKPICPDIAVVDGLIEVGPAAEANPSYTVGIDGPPPRVIIEISSKGTWLEDLKPEGKRSKYFEMQVKEYFVFDPHRRTIWTKEWRRHNRLIGWRRNPQNGEYYQLEKDEAGRLWSEELESWLGAEAEENLLRLYDEAGQQYLSEAEDKSQQLVVSQANVELERARTRQERERAERERERAEQERHQRESAEAKLTRLAEELRRLGQNPDDLL